MTNVISPNPFTPKSGWEPRVFTGRENEIEFFKKKLQEGVEIKRYDHFLIRGDWGVGKTSLLKEYKKIAQAENHLCSYVPVSEFQEGDKFIAATQHLVTHIPRNLPVKHEKLKKLREFLAGWGIALPVIGGGITVPLKELKGDPQILLLDALVRLWQDIKDIREDTSVIIVLIDDVHNYKSISGYLTILKNVLSNEEIVKGTGFLFVLASTFAGWAQFIQKHHPIGRYFTPSVKLSNLTREEVSSFIDQTLDSTGVIFSPSICQKVYEYTEGHPLELQILCSYLYENQIGGKVTDEVWEVSLDATLIQIGEILLDALYGIASERERQILKVFARTHQSLNWKDITEEMKEKDAKFPAESIGMYLGRMVEKELLKQEKRGPYSLPDRMFREYLLRM